MLQAGIISINISFLFRLSYAEYVIEKLLSKHHDTEVYIMYYTCTLKRYLQVSALCCVLAISALGGRHFEKNQPLLTFLSLNITAIKLHVRSLGMCFSVNHVMIYRFCLAHCDAVVLVKVMVRSWSVCGHT